MTFTKEELDQIYDHVAEKLIASGVMQLTKPKENAKIAEVIKVPSREPKDINEGLSEAIQVPSVSSLRAHTMEWTQGGRPSN